MSRASRDTAIRTPRPVAQTRIPVLDQSFVTNVQQHMRSGYQFLSIETTEEARVESELLHAAQGRNAELVIWDSVNGFTLHEDDVDDDGRRHPGRNLLNNLEANPPVQQPYNDPLRALRAIVDNKVVNFDGIFVFRDLADHFNNLQLRRLIRNLATGNHLVNRHRRRLIVITGPRVEAHPNLKSCLTPIDFSLPGEQGLSFVLDFILESIASAHPEKANVSPELRTAIINAMLGMTTTEAENCLSRCAIACDGLNPTIVPMIKQEKAAIIQKGEMLTFVDESTITDIDQIGGYDRLIEFVRRRKLAYTPTARELQIDYPKGIVLLGVPGSGKSRAAETIGKILDLSVMILNVPSIFGKYVGESETRMRDVIRQITAQKGCVLVLDEVDKVFSGATESNSDSGVSRRVFGQLLTWLANKQDRTFVVVTMNRTKGIPPEFFRAGRFDALFFVDVPNPQEREEIMKIHLRKRGVDPDTLGLEAAQWADLAGTKTDEFVGAEIEQIVKDARLMAFEERQVGTPSFPEFVKAAGAIRPVAKLDPEGLAEIRTMSDRAMNVRRERAPTRTGRTRHIDTSGN